MRRAVPEYRVTQIRPRHIIAGAIAFVIIWATTPPQPNYPSYEERVAAELLRLQIRGDSILSVKRDR